MTDYGPTRRIMRKMQGKVLWTLWTHPGKDLQRGTPLCGASLLDMTRVSWCSHAVCVGEDGDAHVDGRGAGVFDELDVAVHVQDI